MKNIYLYILNIALLIYDTYKRGMKINIHFIRRHLRNNAGEVSVPLCDTEKTKRTLKGNSGETEIVVTRAFGTHDFKELYERYIRSQLENIKADGLTNKD